MNNRKKTYQTLAGVAAVGGSLYAMNAAATKLTKSLLYCHYKEDDRPSLLESRYQCENILINNNEGVKLRGLFINQDNAQQTLVILHPYALEAKDMSLYVPFLKEYIKDSHILLVDACAHGQSDGYIRGLGIKDVNDLVCWNQYLLGRFGKEHQLVLFGKECGANTILNAAGKHVLKNVKAIISDGAYTSPQQILGYRLVQDYKIPKMPMLLLLQRKIKRAVHINIKEDTTNYVKHNDIPTLYIHLKNDDFVPLKMVYPLYNANRGKKELFVLKDEKYLYELDSKSEMIKDFKQFIDQYVNG